MKNRLPIGVYVTLFVSAILILAGATAFVRADGSETLGPPTVPISEGSGVVGAGTGLEVQPGIVDLSVPKGATVEQVLMYWSGASPANGSGDDTLLVGGETVTGTLIGGPTKFFSRKGQNIEFYTYRADITDLNLVSAGENLIEVSEMDFEEENHGAGILAIYDDGSIADIQIVDGQDLAYKFFNTPLDTVVPQTITFEPSDHERTAKIVHFAGSVRSENGERRPNIIRITVDGETTEYIDPLNSSDGLTWDTDTTPVIIPPGVTSFTVEVLSDGEVGEERPASFSWIGLTAVIPDPDDPPNILGCADFGAWVPGSNIEGFGTVHPNLAILTSGGRAVVRAEGEEPLAYWAPNPDPDRIMNGGMPDGGFADTTKLHDYEFQFVPGTFTSASGASGFSIRLVDYGDFNKYLATQHTVELIGYDADGNEIDSDGFFYTTTTSQMPRKGEFNGQPFNPYVEADAMTSQPGQPGNYTLAVYGDNLASAKLLFRNNSAEAPDRPSDSLFAITTTCIVPEETPEPSCVDFGALEPGSNVEGMGTVQPDLDISTTSGKSIVLAAATTPKAYDSPNDMPDRIPNGNLNLLGGFSDMSKVHDYAFTFGDGLTVSEFSLRTMDYGDWNPNIATEHEISLVGLDSSGAIVDADTVSFTTAPYGMPRKGEMNGEPFNPYVQADASAESGELGNYRFQISGEGIVRVEMRYNNNVAPNEVSDNLFAIQDVCYLAQ